MRYRKVAVQFPRWNDKNVYDKYVMPDEMFIEI